MMKKVSLWTAAVFILMVLVSAGSSFGAGIEYDYAEAGDNQITSSTVEIGDQGSFTIYRPNPMTESAPIITWGYGTRDEDKEYNPEAYGPLLRHLAEWGFVVIESHSGSTGDGVEMAAGVEYLLQQNTTPGSVFHEKLDTDHIGTAGHSQGGGGAIAAAAALGSRVKCVLPVASKKDWRIWRKVTCPVFLIAGSNDFIVNAYDLPLNQGVETLLFGRAQVAPTIFGVIDGFNHFNFTGDFGSTRGYITAWFMWLLKNDTEAKQAFVDDDCEQDCENCNNIDCEICNNTMWTVQTKNGFNDVEYVE